MGQQTRRGIREIPNDMPPHWRNVLTDMRQAILDTYGPKQGLIAPTNFVGTPLAQANLVQWTRSNGDYYEVMWNETADIITAHIVDVGDSGQWHDLVGNAAHTRWYWVRAARFHGEKSTEAGPVKLTTLAAGSNVATPAPPPASTGITINPMSGNLNPRGTRLL